jgi:hypothetical protein
MAITRRTFVGWLAAVAPASRAWAGARQPVLPTAPLDPALVRAVGDAVLPSALGADGMRRATDAFQTWVDGYRPEAEVNHGYGTGTITRTAADPRPRWTQQLTELEAEARRAHGKGFATIGVGDRQTLIRAAIDASAQRRPAGGRTPSANDIASGAQPQTAESLPEIARAPHVAIAVLAHFYESSEATDLCYEAEIGKNQCRPLAAQTQRPTPLARRRG